MTLPHRIGRPASPHADDLYVQILKLLAQGYSCQRIADELNYHVNTIKYHIGKMRVRYDFGNCRLAYLPMQAAIIGLLATRNDCQVVSDFAEYLTANLDNSIWTDQVRDFIRQKSVSYIANRSMEPVVAVA